MNCIICNQEIENDSQFINDNWYHNKCIENLQQQYERLNNIINEFEKWVIECVTDEKMDLYFQGIRIIDILDKLKELKGE